MSQVYTGASLFLHSLTAHGVNVAFVNLGSDHPALVEEIAQQKVDSRKKEEEKLSIYTSPNEFVGLSAAQGYAQLTGETPAVFVHVDCGTQNLGGGLHNVSRNRVPILIYAGASPHTSDSSLQGGRNEWIHWIQNTIDQPSIVRRFVKYVGELRRAVSVDQVIGRSLQMARSEPAGPVYVWGVRESTEEFLTKEQATKQIVPSRYAPLQPMGIASSTVDQIASLLLAATSPVIVTSYLGRDPKAVPVLGALAKFLQIPVFQSCPTHMNLPHSHPCHAGSSYGMANPWLNKACYFINK
ncbi:thiamine diphosphate-binding protein [Atractiella rhizophila]|nr:thiamine diphosphate-binding protein [Atractiella rhizophila]